jgi:hypothetical protein
VEANNYPYESASFSAQCRRVCCQRETGKIIGEFPNKVKWCCSVCEKCGASKPRRSPIHTTRRERDRQQCGGHLLRRDFFVWTSRFVYWSRKKKLCLKVGQILLPFWWWIACWIGRVAARETTPTRHREPLDIDQCVWDGAAVALAVTEGMNHQKCVLFPLLPFIYAPQTLYGKRASH